MITRRCRSPQPQRKSKKNPRPGHVGSRGSLGPSKRHRWSVDVVELLFSRERHFLIRNNGGKVWVDDLKGKTVVLFIIPIDLHDYGFFIKSGDVTQAYHDLFALGGIEFVFVPVYLNKEEDNFLCWSAFHQLFSALPFPCVPFPDIEACGDRLFHAFEFVRTCFPYWVIIDPTTLVLTRAQSIIPRVPDSIITTPRSRSTSTSPPPPPIKRPIKRQDIDTGYTVDLRHLLFTRDRDFLIKNNGQKVSARLLRGKTVVLYIVPIDDHRFMRPGENLDIIQAYHELLPMGASVEFVFVPVYDLNKQQDNSATFHNLFSALPFPAVPFSDTKACGDRVVHFFSIAQFRLTYPYWVIIDPTSTVVATRARFLFLFKLYGGAEIYPLSAQRIRAMEADLANYPKSRKRLIRNWDQLLASPTRDFLLSSNGAHVPISSLKGKLIGLYFCDNLPCPPRMDVIKHVYQQAKSRGYDFEIVQINFHFQFYYACYCTEDAVSSQQQHYENINWLTLPFKDPSCRKLQRIFKCEFEDDMPVWKGDCLVIVDSRQADEVVYEFAGAEVIQEYGIEAYPFTRPSIYETEYTRLKREVKLQLLFPPGLCQFTTWRDGFNLVNDSQLKGKRVLVLFGKPSECKNNAFVSMLKSKYREQAEEDKFEVVYVSIRDCESSSFTECIQDMPWLVHPYSHEFGTWSFSKIFRFDGKVEVAAFGIDGELIARGYLGSLQQLEHRFPFFSQDLRQLIQEEGQIKCDIKYYVGD